MDLITALETVKSRSHGPYENDWDLLQAAETLAEVLKKEPKTGVLRYNKYVQVVKGPMKGHIGVLTDMDETSVEVSFVANGTKVLVKSFAKELVQPLTYVTAGL